MPENSAAYQCPYCHKRHLEAVATLPYVRGEGLGAAFNAKTIAGCRSCVRKQLLLESLRSSVDGWASPVALLANPVLITYGVARAAIVKRDEPRVRRMLHAAGIPGTDAEIEPVRIAYGLAAALIAADGKLLREEITMAVAIGKQLFADFNERDFLAVVSARRDLPTPEDLAIVLKRVVNQETKAAVYKYLVAIAAADNEVAPEEQTLLMSIARNLGISGPGQGVDRSA